MNELPILFQDEWFVAVDKPAGHLVHPADEPQPDDLVTMKILRDQVNQHIHVIHRLDRPTTGVILFATQKLAAKKARQSFEKRLIEKRYLAICKGHPKQESWQCNLPLKKSDQAPEKNARTSFRVLEHIANDLSLIEAQPHTGRFHQIRRHLLCAGHPIIGDFRYLGEEESYLTGRKLGIGTRMLLQAQSLSLIHPITKNKLMIEAPRDPLFSKVILKKNSPSLATRDGPFE